MENVAGEQDLALKATFPMHTLYKLTLALQGAQTWPFWYFRCALSISGIL